MAGKLVLKYWLQLIIGAGVALTTFVGLFGVVVALLLAGVDPDADWSAIWWVLWFLILLLAAILHRLDLSGIVVGLVAMFGVITVQAGRSENFVIDQQLALVVGVSSVVVAGMYGILMADDRLRALGFCLVGVGVPVLIWIVVQLLRG